MKAVIQRVSEAAVNVDGKPVASIGKGFLVLVGVHEDDGDSDLEFLAKKIPAMRIFADSEGKMNLSLLDVSGDMLIVSQFTLCADTAKGNRPSYFSAAKPEKATHYYEAFVQKMKNLGIDVHTGIFGADMKVSLINDGPVTIILDSKCP